MTSYLTDTTVLIDHIRGQTSATRFISQNRPYISIVCQAELIQGSKDKSSLILNQKLCEKLNIIPISERTSLLAIRLISEHFLSHHLEFLDALIAATAINLSLTLVTSNAKHFSFIPNLQLRAWQDIEKTLKSTATN